MKNFVTIWDNIYLYIIYLKWWFAIITLFYKWNFAYVMSVCVKVESFKCLFWYLLDIYDIDTSLCWVKKKLSLGLIEMIWKSEIQEKITEKINLYYMIQLWFRLGHFCWQFIQYDAGKIFWGSYPPKGFSFKIQSRLYPLSWYKMKKTVLEDFVFEKDEFKHRVNKVSKIASFLSKSEFFKKVEFAWEREKFDLLMNWRK